jgi:hypothetical protein
MSTPSLKVPATISTSEFLIKLLQISWRLPSNGVRRREGLRSIGGNRNGSWGLELEKPPAAYPEHPAVKSPDGSLTYPRTQ